MTDITEVLRRAADVQPPIDVAADLRRGRAFARRRQLGAAAASIGGAVVLGAALAVAFGAHPDGHDGSKAHQSLAVQPTPDGHATSSHDRVPSHHAAPHRTIRAATIAPDTLTHTRYFDVPPSPAGWHLVGTTINYVMVAPDGTQPPLEGGFQGNLVVGLTDGSASYPTTYGTPLDFDGRVFWQWHDSGNTQIAVRDAEGAWLIAQYPDDAGFQLNAMVAYLDAVRPLPGTVTAS